MMRSLGVLVMAAVLGAGASARAQHDDDLIPATREYRSPERLILELHVGPYDAGEDASLDGFIGDDAGPLLAMTLEYVLLRVPDILYANIGAGIGWMRFTGSARDLATGETVGEDTRLTVIPLQAIGSIRIDALPRKLHLPFIFTGKLGWQWAHWSTGTGSVDDANGWSLGLLYGGQIALDLDTFEPAAARAMDEEWGINHTYLFFELMRFETTKKSLPIGDTYWSAGLGFVF